MLNVGYTIDDLSFGMPKGDFLDNDGSQHSTYPDARQSPRPLVGISDISAPVPKYSRIAVEIAFGTKREPQPPDAMAIGISSN
jgi:hypothetical protein